MRPAKTTSDLRVEHCDRLALSAFQFPPVPAESSFSGMAHPVVLSQSHEARIRTMRGRWVGSSQISNYGINRDRAGEPSAMAHGGRRHTHTDPRYVPKFPGTPHQTTGWFAGATVGRSCVKEGEGLGNFRVQEPCTWGRAKEFGGAAPDAWIKGNNTPR